jgi:aminopeptidase N
MPTMWDDGFSSSHPLAVKVATRAEILASAFDKITSRKGASIMRMVESVFGASQVQNGFKVILNSILNF